MPLPIPDCPWSQIGVDFIVKLPTSDGWDSIMVVVDHFSKTAHFIPAWETWDAAKVATAFVSSVFRLHGLPDRIVSDRGSSFMSRFWKEVQRLLCISPAPSTAFHPATDGQVERVNAILEDFLRQFVNIRQDDWVLWLPIAELSYNNTPSSSTSTSPFFACHGFHPRFNSLTVSSTVPRADLWIRQLQAIQDRLVDMLAQAKRSQAKFYNAGRRVADVFSQGDLVWLSRRNLKTSRPFSKLDVRRVGPFPVDHMVGTNTVKLLLPAEYRRLHPVFDISLIKRYIPPVDVSRDTDLPILTELADGLSAAHGIRAVLAFWRSVTGADEYLVRFGSESGLDDAWTPLSAIPPSIFPLLLSYHRLSPHVGPGPPPVLAG